MKQDWWYKTKQILLGFFIVLIMMLLSGRGFGL